MRIPRSRIAAAAACLSFAGGVFAAEVTTLTKDQYQDIAGGDWLWKANAKVPESSEPGDISLETPSNQSFGEYTWQAEPGANKVTLQYDQLSSLLTFSVVGPDGRESVQVESPWAGAFAMRLTVNDLTDRNGTLSVSHITVNGISYDNSFTVDRNDSFDAFMIERPEGVNRITFDLDWNGRDPDAFAAQLVGFQAVPEPGTTAFLVMGSLALYCGNRWRKRAK